MNIARDQFIEQMGLMAQAEGWARIAGQILGYLIVEGEPRTLNQMTETLKISKASASTNARMLELRGSVRRVSALGQRQDAYQAVDEPSLQTLIAMATRFRDNAQVIGAIATGFPDSDAGARARVDGIAEFYRDSAAFIDEWTARISAEHCAALADDEKEKT